METPEQQIQAKCKEVFAKAKQFWPHLSFDDVPVSFDLKGRCAGMAHWGYQFYKMRFNRDMLRREAFDHILNDTVPHEIAHIVCAKDPRLGKNHDFGWASVCRKLGGSGKRTHNEDVVYGKGKTYEYTSTTGHKVRLSEQRHRKIQFGTTFRWRSGKGNVDKSCAYSIVGMQGHTLAVPIVKRPPVIAPAHIRVMVDTSRNVPRSLVDAAVKLTGGHVVSDPVINEVLGFPPKVEEPATERVNISLNKNYPIYAELPRKPRLLHEIIGKSKAETSRKIMKDGHANGCNYEEIIQAMMIACGYNRQLARATYKANAAKVGLPIE